MTAHCKKGQTIEVGLIKLLFSNRGGVLLFLTSCHVSSCQPYNASEENHKFFNKNSKYALRKHIKTFKLKSRYDLRNLLLFKSKEMHSQKISLTSLLVIEISIRPPGQIVPF